MRRIAAAALVVAVGISAGQNAQAQQTPAATTQQAKPPQAKPPQAKPAQAKPAQAKPAEAKPAQAKPAAAPQTAAPPAGQSPAGGGVPVLLGQFGDWAAYASQAPRTKICYALSQPKDRQPGTLKRDPGFLFISHRPGEGVRNEVSAMMGFALKDGGDATLQVGNVVFAMATKDDNVWIKNPAEEGRLVETMRRGKDVTIKGTSRRGNDSTDRYSLSGLGQALDRMTQECK